MIAIATTVKTARTTRRALAARPAVGAAGKKGPLFGAVAVTRLLAMTAEAV
jgi:hypothetical protein